MSTTNGLLTREAILSADDIQTERVSMRPIWDGDVLVRGMTGTQRDQFETELLVGKGKNRDVNMRGARAKLVAFCVVDEAGAPLFTARDVEALGQKSAAALDRIFDVASRLSGIGDADMEELTEVFAPTPTGDSPTA